MEKVVYIRSIYQETPTWMEREKYSFSISAECGDKEIEIEGLIDVTDYYMFARSINEKDMSIPLEQFRKFWDKILITSMDTIYKDKSF